MRVEEERDALPERIDVETCVDRRLHVRSRMGQREGDLLDGGRSRFTNVVAADGNAVPLWQLALAEGNDVGDDAKRRPGRVDICAARDVFLEDVVLHRAGEGARSHALAFRDREVEREQDDRGGVDGHRRRHTIERNAVEERGHVFNRIDRHADASDFTGGERMVRVVSNLRRQVERDAQAADPLGEQIPVSPV